MKLKKLASLLLALTVCLTLFAACAGKTGDTTTTAADEQTAAADAAETTEAPDAAAQTQENGDYGSERDVANFAGVYGSDRCTITTEAIDDSTMKISVHWASSAAEADEWEMSGMFDPDTMRVNYSDCTHKRVVYAEDGTSTETLLYENGYGRIQFVDQNTLIWQDEQDNAASGMEFTNLPPAE